MFGSWRHPIVWLINLYYQLRGSPIRRVTVKWIQVPGIFISNDLNIQDKEKVIALIKARITNATDTTMTIKLASLAEDMDKIL